MMTNSEHSRNPSFLLTRLSVMMFIQFFIWGAWYLTVSRYMIDHQMEYQAYYAYTAGPLAAIITPFLFGLFVDRFFDSQKYSPCCSYSVVLSCS